MAAEKFSSEMNNRGTVKVTDKLMIQNIDTGAVEYTTVSKLLQALSIFGNVGFGTTNPSGYHASTDNFVVAGLGTTGITISSTDSNNTYLVFADGTANDNKKLAGYIKYDHSIDEMSFITGGESGSRSTRMTIGTSKFKVAGIPVYNDNTNAAASGLTAGEFYRTGDDLKIVH